MNDGVLGREYSKSTWRVVLLSVGALLMAAIATAFVVKWVGGARDRFIGPVHDVAFFPDGGRFATANQDGTVRIWDSGNGTEIHSLGSQPTAVTSIAISPDGSLLAAEFGDWRTSEYGVTIWDAVTGLEWKRFPNHAGRVNDVAFTPDGKYIVTASSDKTVRVTAIQDGTELFCLRGHNADVNAVAISPNGQSLLSGAGDYSGGELHDPTIRQWSLKDGSFVREFARESSAFRCVSFSSDGTIVAAVADNRLRVWNLTSGAEIASAATSSPDWFQCVAIHPRSRSILTGSSQRDAIMQVRNIPEGNVAATLVTKTTAHSVALSPDGKRLVSAHGDSTRGSYFWGTMIEEGTAIVWDVESGTELLRIAETSGEG